MQSVGFKLHPPGEKSAISSFLLTCVEDWLTDDCDVLKYDRLGGSALPQFWPKLIIFFPLPCARCTDFFFLIFFFLQTHTHAHQTRNQTSTLSPSHSGHRHRRCCLRPRTCRYAIYFCKELSHYFAPRLMKLRPTCTKLQPNTFPFGPFRLDSTVPLHPGGGTEPLATACFSRSSLFHTRLRYCRSAKDNMRRVFRFYGFGLGSLQRKTRQSEREGAECT